MRTLLAQIGNRSVQSPTVKNKATKGRVSVASGRDGAVPPAVVDKENVMNSGAGATQGGSRRAKKEEGRTFSGKQNVKVSTKAGKAAQPAQRISSDSRPATNNDGPTVTAISRTVTLADICAREKMSSPVLKYYAIQIALKLQALHDKGLIHGHLRLNAIASKNSQLVIDDLHSECRVGDFFGSKLSSGAAVPPEMVAVLDEEQLVQYRKYWKPIMDDDICMRLTIGSKNAKHIEGALKASQRSKGGNSQVKSPLRSGKKQPSAKRRDWKAAIGASLEGMKFEDLPDRLSSASNIEEFAREWHRMVANSNRWAELEPRTEPSDGEGNDRWYVLKSFNDFDGSDRAGSLLSELLPYELLEASPAIDVWGLGSILLEMITGRSLLVKRDAYALLREWGGKARDESLAAVEDDVIRDLLSRLLASDPSKRPKSIKHVLEHAFFAAEGDEDDQSDVAPKAVKEGISLMKGQVVVERNYGQNEEFAWYEQGRFPLLDSDGENLPPEEELQHVQRINKDLRNALSKQNKVMSHMAKTNFDLQSVLAHQISLSAEKDALLKKLQASLGEEESDRSQQKCEELSLLKAQVADMEHTVLDKIEENEILISTASAQDKAMVGDSVTDKSLREENDKLQEALLERSALMEEMARTNQDIQNALSQQLSILAEKDALIESLRTSLAGETDQNKEARETIRILEAQVSDMQESMLLSSEENEMRVSTKAEGSRDVEMLQKLVDEQTVRINEQKLFIEELEQALKERKEKAEERKEEIVSLKEKLNRETGKCKKVIKAQGRIIEDLRKGLKTHKDHVKDSAARYQKQLREIQTKKADLNVALNLQTKFTDKMARMNKELQKKMYEQELRLEAKDTKLRSLEYALSSDDMSIKSGSTTEASVAAEELRRDLVNTVNSKQQIINERDEKIKELYDTLEIEKKVNEDLVRTKKTENEHVKQALEAASLRYAEALAQLKIEAEANQRANMAVCLASVPTVAICAVYALRQWKLGC